MNIKSIIIVVITILFICSLPIIFKNQPRILNIKLNNLTIRAEIVQTDEERRIGLMNREFLEKNTGMIFVYEEEQNLSFWMKNTLIPLDILFIDENRSIVDIIQNMKPCTKDPCKIYKSRAMAKYALELNSGFVNENKIKIGDPAEFNL